MKLGAQGPGTVSQCRGFLTTASLEQHYLDFKKGRKYTIKPIGLRKTGGRDHTGEAGGGVVVWTQD